MPDALARNSCKANRKQGAICQVMHVALHVFNSFTVQCNIADLNEWTCALLINVCPTGSGRS
jgi:hypothetical protein